MKRLITTALAACLLAGTTMPALAVTLIEINEALGPERARDLKQRNARLAADNSIQLATLEAIVEGIGSAMDPIDYGKLIEEAADLAVDAGELRAELGALKDQLASLPPTERESAEAALARAQDLFDAGKLSEAETAFAEIAEAAFGKLGSDLDAWEEAIDAQARTAMLRGDYDGATDIQLGADAKLEAMQAELDRQRWRRIVGAADAQHKKGEKRGDNRALERAIAQYNRALTFATRDRVPLDWAATQNNFGNALQTLGERESGTERLQQAVTAYRAALEERTRDRVPLEWAATQNALGNSLQTLGDRESGTEQLQQAVTAYRAALEERTRDRVPLDWAMTQNNLGNALRNLGERERGTEQLQQAITAYRAALEEYTRSRVPLDWAMVQNNLGAALQILGERESGTERLQQAVTAYRAALEEFTRDRVPLQWAMAQNNLGGVLLALGERESGTERIQQAVTAYRAALEELTADRDPRNHASTSGGLALTSEVIHQRDPFNPDDPLHPTNTFTAAANAFAHANMPTQAQYCRDQAAKYRNGE